MGSGFKEVIRKLIFSVVSILLAFVICSIIILILKENPLKVLSIMFQGSFGSLKAISNTLQFATPLIFTGLAVAFAFQGGLFNVGGEGQLFFAAFCTALIGSKFGGLPVFFSLILVFIIAFFAGGFWGFVPGYLKTKWGVHEVISTIMLNYVMFNLTNYLVMLPSVKAPGQIPKTADILPQYTFPQLKMLSSTTRLNIGFLVAIVLCILIFILLYYTILGFKIRTTGKNPSAAKLAGINTKKIILTTMLISGGLAGFAGAEQVSGVYHSFISPFPEGMGFLGIAVALVGRNHPIGVIFAAILFGALDAGGARVDMLTSVPREIIFILEGIIILFVASEYLLKFFSKKKNIKEVEDV